MIWVLRLSSCLGFLGTVRFLGDEPTILVSNGLTVMARLRSCRQLVLYNGTDSLLGVGHSRNSRLELSRQLQSLDKICWLWLPFEYRFRLLEHALQASLRVQPTSMRYLSYCEEVWVSARKHAWWFSVRSVARNRQDLLQDGLSRTHILPHTS